MYQHKIFQFRKLKRQGRNLRLPSASAGFLLGLLLDTENGADMFLQKFGLSPKYKALQPRRQYSSFIILFPPF
jgi:hypothetical protein